MTKEMKGAVLLLSGGVDSTALLSELIYQGVEPVVGLAVHYGQRHSREIDSARNIAAAFGVELVEADIQGAAHLLAGSSQTSDDVQVPHGHYTDASMAATVVPNRNLLLLSLAGALAQSRGIPMVAYAAHAGDHPIYPDCRPEFVEAAAGALRLGADVALYAPFVLIDKAEVVRRGAAAGAPFELTWSCYQGGEAHCGRCGTCVERREAFQLAGISDPTEWEVS